MTLAITPYTDLPDNWRDDPAQLDGLLISGMPDSVYHSAPGISKSGLDLVARSPAHYRYQEARQPTRAMTIGKALHAALLEPERFAENYLLLRDVTDRRSSEYKQAIKHHDAELVLNGREADYVAGMQESVYSHPAARARLSGAGETELSVFAVDPETGALLRARLDKLTGSDEALILDLKKTQDARRDPFARSIFNYGYHVQDAFYRHVFRLATGIEADFEFVVSEEHLPHATTVYQLDDLSRQEGHRIAMETVRTYAECCRVNEWPAYSDQIEYISLPAWALAQIDERADDEFVADDEVRV